MLINFNYRAYPDLDKTHTYVQLTILYVLRPILSQTMYN